MAKVELERLSEKMHEQRLERGFAQCTEREVGLRVVCSATPQAPRTLFGQSQKKKNSRKFAVTSGATIWAEAAAYVGTRGLARPV
jgi:hypothetical protein